MGSPELGGVFYKGREKLKMTWGTFSALSLEKQLPDALHLPGQKPALKMLQVLAVPPGLLRSAPQMGLRPEQGITGSGALSHPSCYVIFEPNQKLVEGTWSEYF